MNSSKHVPPLVLLLALFGGAWLVIDATDSTPLLPDSRDGVLPTSAPIAGADPEPLGSTPSRKSAGRTVLVLDPAGQPVPGAKVFHHLKEDANGIERFLQDKDSIIPYKLIGIRTWAKGGPLITDYQGIAVLPDTGYGYLGSDTDSMAGLIALMPPPESGKQEVILTLDAYSTLPFQVIHADGSPAQGFVAAVALVNENQPPSGRGIQPLPTILHEAQPTDAAGRSFIRNDFEAVMKLRNQTFEEGDRIQLQASFPLGVSISETVHQGQTKPVVLQLPGFGSVQVQLKGFPKDNVPEIMNRGSSDFGRPGITNSTSTRTSDDTWEFDQIPLGQKVIVQVHQRTFQQFNGERHEGRRGTSFKGIEATGPTLEGEVVKVVLDYSNDIHISGRLMDHLGNPLKFDRQRQELSIQSQATGFCYQSQGYSVDMKGDGYFVARFQNPEKASLSTTPLNRLVIQLAAKEVGSYRLSNEPKGPIHPFSYAALDLPIDVRVASHDIGEVQLQAKDPLIEIKAIDFAGNPIQDARIGIRFLGPTFPNNPIVRDDWLSISSRSGWQHIKAEGVLRVYGSDWETICYGGYQADVEPVYRPVSNLRVTAGHRDYLSNTIDCSAIDREITVVLSLASTLTGSLKCSPLLMGMKLSLIDAGSAYSTRSKAMSMINIFENRGNDEPRLEMEELNWSGLEQGLYDLVVLSSHRPTEVFRIPGISIGPGKNSDPRLQGLDLLPQLDIVRLQLVDESDRQFIGKEIEAKKKVFIRQLDGSKGGGGGKCNIMDDAIIMEIGKGQALYASVQLHGYALTKMAGLKAGTHRIQLSKMLPCHLVWTNTADLPQDAKIEVTVDGENIFGTERFSNDPDFPEKWSGKLPNAGPYLVYLHCEVNGTRHFARIPFEVSEEQLAGGGGINLTFPADFIQKVHGQQK